MTVAIRPKDPSATGSKQPETDVYGGSNQSILIIDTVSKTS